MNKFRILEFSRTKYITYFFTILSILDMRLTYASCRQEYDDFVTSVSAQSLVQKEKEKPNSQTFNDWVTRGDNPPWSTLIYFPMALNMQIYERLSFSDFKKREEVLLFLDEAYNEQLSAPRIQSFTQELKDEGYNVTSSDVRASIIKIDSQNFLCRDGVSDIQELKSIDYFKVRLRADLVKLKQNNLVKHNITCVDVYSSYLKENAGFNYRYNNLEQLVNSSGADTVVGLVSSAIVADYAFNGIIDTYGIVFLGVVYSAPMSSDLIETTSIYRKNQKEYADTLKAKKLLKQAELGQGNLLSDALMELRESGSGVKQSYFIKWLQTQNRSLEVCDGAYPLTYKDIMLTAKSILPTMEKYGL